MFSTALFVAAFSLLLVHVAATAEGQSDSEGGCIDECKEAIMTTAMADMALRDTDIFKMTSGTTNMEKMKMTDQSMYNISINGEMVWNRICSIASSALICIARCPEATGRKESLRKSIEFFRNGCDRPIAMAQYATPPSLAPPSPCVFLGIVLVHLENNYIRAFGQLAVSAKILTDALNSSSVISAEPMSWMITAADNITQEAYSAYSSLFTLATTWNKDYVNICRPY